MTDSEAVKCCKIWTMIGEANTTWLKCQAICPDMVLPATADQCREKGFAVVNNNLECITKCFNWYAIWAIKQLIEGICIELEQIVEIMQNDFVEEK